MKRMWIIILIVILLAGAGTGAYVLYSRGSVTKNPDMMVELVSPTPSSKTKLTTWTDPAGFSFQYPEGLVFNKHDEDSVNYAHLELTDSTHPGSIIIWEKDLPQGVNSAATWVKKDAVLSDGIMFDTTLGGKAAKKVLISSPAKKLFVGTLDDDVLVYIEGTLADDSYWQGIADGIVTTFAFAPQDTPAPQAAGTAGSGTADTSADAADEEETLQ
jgi:hypothetical protein